MQKSVYTLAFLLVCFQTFSQKKPTVPDNRPMAAPQSVKPTDGKISLLPAPVLQNLELTDIFGNTKFAAKSVSELRSMNDGEHYSNTDDKNNIIVYEYKSGNAIDTIVRIETLKEKSANKDFSFDEYSFSRDETKILLSTETESIYRHSTRSNYFVFDLKKKTLVPVSLSGKQMYGTFNGTGNKVAFVRDNNLYLKDLVLNTETAVTKDGSKNSIINGATDWVYEEEFSFSQGYQWNVTGDKIAYYRFDESRVKEFTLTYYDSLYPRNETYKYPKAGEENSKVEIFIYDVASGKSVKADANKEADQYIPRIKWTAEAEKLCILRMNRHQNHLEYLICNASTGATKLMMQEDNKSFIEINDDLTFLDDKQRLITTSSRSGYNHIYLWKMDGSLEKQITTGNFDVTQYYGYDATTKTFFYQSAEVSAMERQVYSVTVDGRKKLLSLPTGTNSANFSSTFKYFVNTYSASGIPTQCTVCSINGKTLRVLEDNSSVKEAMKNYNISQQVFFKMKTVGNIELNGWMIKPPDFNPSKKYPVMVFVYGGPGVQTVRNAWGGSGYFWYQLLAQKGFVVVSVDNRGTPGRGLEFANCIYKNMGNYEVQDQIELAKYLQQQPYIDKDRIAVHGWSFGGYMTALLLTKGADYFKLGMSVAPVTNWRYYDSIYTERYLQTPQENAKGYDDNSPIYFVDKLKGKFLLVHGLTDDNVHFQNSAEFTNALLKKKKQFDSFYYPNKAHSLSGMRLHVYTMMTDYLLKNL